MKTLQKNKNTPFSNTSFKICLQILTDVSSFSSLPKLLRVTAWIRRIFDSLKQKCFSKTVLLTLNVSSKEIKAVELL